MNSKDVIGFMEAYSEVYAPQEIEEAVKGADPEMRKAASAERRAGHRPLPAKEGERYASHKLAQMAYAKRKKMEEEVEQVDEGKVELDQERRSRMGRQIGKKVRSAEAEYSLSKDTMYPKGLRGAMEKGARKKVGQAQKIMGALKSAQKEELDIFDVVLEFLQAEGFAETLEEAEWMMANLIDEEIVNDILEATYSAKAARAGKDIGKPGKAFAKIAASAAKRYGSKERGEKVAGAVLAKLRARHEEVEYVDEADSLAAMAARREKRLQAQRKREGRPSGGGDFGHDYGKPHAQAAAEREQRMKDFINKK